MDVSELNRDISGLKRAPVIRPRLLSHACLQRFPAVFLHSTLLHLVKLSQLLPAQRTDRQSDLMCVRDPDHALLLHIAMS